MSNENIHLSTPADQRADGEIPAGVNIADLAVDKHVREGRGSSVALRWLKRGPDGVDSPTDVTYAMLSAQASCFASALTRRGLANGVGLATVAGRIPELYIAALGTLKAQGVFTPLFSAFGPDPIVQRMNLGRIKVLVTTPLLFRRKIEGILDRIPHIQLVLICGASESQLNEQHRSSDGPTVMSFDAFLASGDENFEIAETPPETPALLHFTSGTTGSPKGVVHVHEAVITHQTTGQFVLDLHQGDVFWCTADPGWVTGVSYGIIAPLTNGVTSIVDEAEFDAERWYRILDTHRVNIFYTAPTALRMLQRFGADLATRSDLSSLRLVASVGEPLDAEAVMWCQDVFGVPVLDTWWQTETGGIMIANSLTQEVRPGSMGKPLPGIEVSLLEQTPDGDLVLDGNGDPVQVVDPDASGELAIREGWPSMFRGYLDQDDRYRSSFVNGWYRSSDLARRDVDGYYWFVGRSDDLIKTAGHLIGPFEVESALNEHPAVVESGVIGKPDETVGAIVKAFVVLGPNHDPSNELLKDLMGHARRKLGAAVAPREIEFVDNLPHTRSGKIMRRVLKAREQGDDVGDISTLEPHQAEPHRETSNE